MGLFDNNEGFSYSSNKLDLVEFENNLLHKFNDAEILETKYKAEEFGISFDKKIRKSDVYYYDGNEEIIICPEPLEFIKEFDDVSDNASKANELLLKKIEQFKHIKLDNVPKLKGLSASGERMWMNKTSTGINLRPGNLNDDRVNFEPIRMCDDNVHGLIAGRTGSGKSVFINALILSLITEYSPWELNLYLADFKKVELSRYMNNADEANYNIAYTPHINACAATSEIRYVSSLIKYLVDCMNARQELFARLGVTKLQEFRSKYNLVLPRVLLIVDEFQQLFIEATNHEKEEIQTMLNSITKLGRATGFHLIFASQEMSGTLRGNTLANFKIRMALPCNQQISTDILGNSQAVNLERGYVLVNTDSGDEYKNKKYRVPFIETEKKDSDDDGKSPFYVFLDEIKRASKLFDLDYKTLSQKFYREELQETENSYRYDLDSIKDKKNELVSKNRGLFDAVILGKTVLYSPKRNDKVSFYIEKGRNKGMMIACPEPDNAARIRKLLAENLFRSGEETYHFAMELNNLVLEKYHIERDILKYPPHKYFNCDIDTGIEFLEMSYYLRIFAQKYIDNKSDKSSLIKSDEDYLYSLLKNDEKMLAYKNNKKEKQELLEKINEIDSNISQCEQDNKKHAINPIVTFFEKCSSEIVLIQKDNTKVNLTELVTYKEVVSAFSKNIDLDIAADKALDILNSKINALSLKMCKDENEKLQNALAIQRNKIFRRAILFFKDKYAGKEPEETKLSEVLERIYSSIALNIELYKKDCQMSKELSIYLRELSDEKEKIQNLVYELESECEEIENAESVIKEHINAYINYVFDNAYSMMGYKKNKPNIPKVESIYEEGSIKWFLDDEGLDKKIYVIASDVLERFIDWYRDINQIKNFKKMVFWINGLDEIEKVPNQLVEVIRNAINYNILVISIITSELKDTTIRKAFDYAFITGNIEKFYTMFNIKYTKQPLDSIVVNFGIRSKGFDIPFKMYKSNLEEVQAPNFIDELLND